MTDVLRVDGDGAVVEKRPYPDLDNFSSPRPEPAPRKSTYVSKKKKRRRTKTYIFITAMAILWAFPLVWTLYTALRQNSDVTRHGYFSLASALTIDNFTQAWTDANIPQAYFNTLIVTIPAVIIALLISSMVAFAVTRFNWRFNLAVLMIFTAGNLLPQQVLIIPLYKIYVLFNFGIPQPLSESGKLYNQAVGILFIHVIFQMGFCIFVLSNYMKTLSKELTEAAQVDGAGVLRIWAGIIMPLCRPALAALSILEFTFIYNDFFWALFLMKDGDRRPITSFLQNLNGMFYTNYSLLAAGAFLAVIPTLIVFFALQRYFISGLTLGSTKG